MVKIGDIVKRNGIEYIVVNILKTKLKARKINPKTRNVSHAIHTIEK